MARAWCRSLCYPARQMTSIVFTGRKDFRMLKGKTAIVTGSIQGLGYALADKLAENGCDIMLSGLADEAVIEAQRSGLEKNTASASAITAPI